MTVVRHDADELLLGFARALRTAGVHVTQSRSQTFLRAAAGVGIEHERAVYFAGQATLCASPEDLRVYDRVFGDWFHEGPLERVSPARSQLTVRQAALDEGAERADGAESDDDHQHLRVAASDVEVLRHRDIAELGPADRARLAAMFTALDPRLPHRRASRRTPWQRGDLDPQATLRQTLRTLGEPVDLSWRRRRWRPRRVVFLVDVSGSMAPYADALLRLAHRYRHGAPARSRDARPGTVEVFTLGTRITRITRALGARDPDRAIMAAGETVPDWSGGTRLGETLRAFLDRWGQRGMARGAVVVVVSDGWERGDAVLLGQQMARLHRLAHRVVWMNPHRGLVGYQPVQQGMAAALPHVDDFVAGHSLAAFADLIEVVADA